MDENRIADVLKRAASAVDGLPEALQAKAFELAVGLLVGPATAQEPSGSGPLKPNQGATLPGQVEVADLLRVAKRNPDRYLIFAEELEARGEQATTTAFLEFFRRYRQDAPRLPARDLQDMVAKSLIEQIGKGREAAYALKRKGRERLAELSAAVTLSKG